MKTIQIDYTKGRIDEIIIDAITQAITEDARVEFSFHGKPVAVDANSNPEHIEQHVLSGTTDSVEPDVVVLTPEQITADREHDLTRLAEVIGELEEKGQGNTPWAQKLRAKREKILGE